MAWADVQRDFAVAMLQDEDAALAQHMRVDADTTAERIAIYRNNILLTLADALAEQYRSIFALVGGTFFVAMAKAYIRENPPEKGDTNHYGESFAQWVAHFPPAEGLPYLSDVARFEWAWNRCFYAARQTVMNADDIAQMDEEALLHAPVEFAEHVKFVTVTYPADELWEYCVRHNGEGEAPDMEQRPRYLMLFRPEQKVGVAELDETLYALCMALENGLSLAEASEKITEDEATIWLERLLQFLIQYQCITGVGDKGAV